MLSKKPRPKENGNDKSVKYKWPTRQKGEEKRSGKKERKIGESEKDTRQETEKVVGYRECVVMVYEFKNSIWPPKNLQVSDAENTLEPPTPQPFEAQNA